MKRNMRGWLFIAVWLVSCLSSPAIASVPATGEFTATLGCQAYQSIKSKTNPGDVQLEVGKSYQIIELNVSPGTTWYRLRIDTATPAERWAYVDCGTVDVSPDQGSSSNGDGHGGGNQCHTVGLKDSYVFAISWQPAFCEGHPDKPECSVSDSLSYQAQNFTLHGFWPNKKSCGTNYGFCGKYKTEVRPFCDYDPVPMQDDTLEKLGKFMPSAAHGSCLQRHEWYKHGTCQTEWSADDYFNIAVRLLSEFNTSGISAFMTGNIGKSVTTNSFFEAVDHAFGENAHRRLQIACSKGKLVDVYIRLPADIPENASLGALIQEAEPAFNNKCGNTFQIDAIGQ